MNKLITLYTETVIDSCHNLRDYEGKCRNLHGHSWKISVWIQGTDEQKDEVGILFDFSNVAKIKEEFDHKYLNEDIEAFRTINPTAENISFYILDSLLSFKPNLQYRVRVYETAVGKETYSQRQTDGFDITYL
jgi:6-pyruvoyltetrahydropterin/6-carboxytetrahydropterin synthase